MESYIGYLVTIVVTVIGSNGLWAFIQSRSARKTAQDRMLLGLGHSEIFRTSQKYIDRGGVTADELEDLVKYLYEPYREMGGNGTGETIVSQVKNLPIISTKEAAMRDRGAYI